MAESMLECKGLYFSRNNHALLSDVNLQVGRGEVLKVVGGNGAGKTTLLKLLCRLLVAQRGGVFWQAQAVTNHLEDFYESLHYVGHRNALSEHLTPLENLKSIAALRGVDSPNDLLASSLTKAGLPQAANHRRCAELSAGQKRRAALARLRAFPAALWVLDEPHAGLDASGKVMLGDWLNTHTQAGGSVVLSMHHTSDWQLRAAREYHCH